MTNILKPSVGLGALLTASFLADVYWDPQLHDASISSLRGWVSILLILLLIFWKERESLTYWEFVKKGLWIGAVGGLVTALFILFYVSFINPHYFEDIAAGIAAKMRSEGHDEIAVNRALRTLGGLRKFHFAEISMFVSTMAKSFGMSLVLGAFVRKRDGGEAVK